MEDIQKQLEIIDLIEAFSIEDNLEKTIKSTFTTLCDLFNFDRVCLFFNSRDKKSRINFMNIILKMVFLIIQMMMKV